MTPEYYPEIRPSEITKLLEQVKKQKYERYLLSIKMQRVRGLVDTEVEFAFPVTALIGPNGGGKSTVLGAAACAYKVSRPSQFFPKAALGDDGMADWSMEYQLIDRHVDRTQPFQRNAAFKKTKWRREHLASREVVYCFTTHSNEALTPLPTEAVCACFDKKVRQGKLDIHALRAISGRADVALAIFVEDDFAKQIVEAMVREFLQDHYDQIEIHVLAGDGNAVKIHTNRLHDPVKKYPSLCIIDGDSNQEENPAGGILRLPGDQPELTVFGAVESKIKDNVALLTVSMQLAPTRQNDVEKTVAAVAATCRDSHVIFNQIGIKLGHVAQNIVASAFINLWLRDNPDIFTPIVEQIKRTLASAEHHE